MKAYNRFFQSFLITLFLIIATGGCGPEFDYSNENIDWGTVEELMFEVWIPAYDCTDQGGPIYTGSLPQCLIDCTDNPDNSYEYCCALCHNDSRLEVVPHPESEGWY